MSDLYSVDLGVNLDSPAIATGHVATKMAWEDGPNGRRPSATVAELDEHDRPLHVVDVLLPIGRDGQPVVLGVTVPGHEVPTPAALSPVTFEGLRAYIRPPRAGKGVEVSLSAESMTSAAPAPASGRKGSASDGEQ